MTYVIAFRVLFVKNEPYSNFTNLASYSAYLPACSARQFIQFAVKLPV
jgi:hypothetical protein